jgi:quercetin dioxygenase-like cupin family protein
MDPRPDPKGEIPMRPNRATLPVLAGLATLLMAPALLNAQAQSMGGRTGPQPILLKAGQLTWGPLEIPGFPSGLQIAVLKGDPSVAGKPYAVRVRFPAGYRFPAHWHPMDENVTVISGTFYLGMGSSSAAGTAKAYHAGDFLSLPNHQPHYGWVEGPTDVQLHGIGPFQTTVVETLKP